MSAQHRSRNAVHEIMTTISVAALLGSFAVEAAPPVPARFDASTTKLQIAIPCAGCSTELRFNTELPANYKRPPPPAIDLQPPRLFEEPLKSNLDALPYRDQAPLINRLRRFQALSFLTLWDSSDATLYVGVNRKGMPGLHLRQKNDRGTILSLR